MSDMPQVVPIAALCVLAGVLCATIRKVSPEQSLLLSLASAVIVLGAALPFLSQIRQLIESLAELSGGVDYECLFRACGIALVTHLASEFCDESRMTAAASALRLFGRAGVIVSCVPLIGSLTSMITEMMSV